MKQRILVLILVLLAASGLAAQSRTMYVATKNVSLKVGTGLFAGTVAGIILNYGDQVNVLQERSGWIEVLPVKDTSKRGWVRSTSLSARRIVAGSSTSASAGELALAGKGFSAEVESSYRQSSGSQANYVEIDRMEAQTVSLQDLYQFLNDGRLNKGGE
jgi:SH3-like domain-containing protein